jgi:hypothetical protein
MTKVYALIESMDGEFNVDLYSTLGSAVDNAEELASLNGWELVGENIWEDPECTGNYISVEVKEVQ